VRDLYKNGRIAFLSAFFFSFFLYSFKESRDHMLDIPTTAIFMASLFLIGRSKHLTNKKYTLLFFTMVAISFLIKWVAVVYFLLPLCIELLYYVMPAKEGYHDKTYDRKKAIANVVIGFCLGLAVNFPWYLVNINRLLTYGTYYAGGEKYSQVGGLFSLANLLFYIKHIVIFHLTLIGTLFFLMCAYIFFKDKANRHKLWVAGAFIFYYCVFTAITNKTARYVIPFMPFIAIIMAYGLNYLIDKAHKHTVPALCGAAIMIWYVFTFFVVSFGIPLYPQYQYAIKLPILGYVDVYYLNTYPVRMLYDNADWRNREIAETIIKELPAFDQRLILVNIDRNYISPATINLAMYEANKGVPRNLEELDTGFPVILKGKETFQDESSLEAYINKADFVVNVTDNIGPKQAMFDFPVRTQIQHYFLQGKATNFRLVRTIPLQDGTKVLIHVRNR
jgi:4-amino-4-deoxy-L-arabinose transferase-like glycosyltransferase